MIVQELKVCIFFLVALFYTVFLTDIVYLLKMAELISL